MPIIINADDYGKDEMTNRAICEAFGRGYITSTTLMANMEGAGDAYRLACENGFEDRVGIHLNITQGMPLTEGIRNNPLICAPDGSFNAAFYHNTKYRLYMDEQSVDQIREEFDAQISRFLELGFRTMHIDSHHHVHTNYPVYRALKKLGGKYGFGYIRLGRNLYRGGSLFNNTYKLFYNSAVSRLAENTSSYFGSYIDWMEYFGLDPMKTEDRQTEPTDEMKRFASGKTVEIMVHPMYDEQGMLVDTDIPMSEETNIRFDIV